MGLFGPSKKEVARQAVEARKTRVRKAKEAEARRHARGRDVVNERDSSLTIRTGHRDADGKWW